MTTAAGARLGLLLSVFFPFAHDVLKLPACGLESIAYGHIDIFMGAVRARLTAHHNVGRFGHHEMDRDVKGVSLVVAVLRPRNDDARADDPVRYLFELLNFFSDACLDGVGMLNAIECDL